MGNSQEIILLENKKRQRSEFHQQFRLLALNREFPKEQVFKTCAIFRFA